jgi:hypothetical protein
MKEIADRLHVTAGSVALSQILDCGAPRRENERRAGAQAFISPSVRLDEARLTSPDLPEKPTPSVNQQKGLGNETQINP